MPLSRRDFLKLGGLTAATLSATSCSVLGRRLAVDELPSSLSAPMAVPVAAVNEPGADSVAQTPADATLRLLNRAGYGPRPGDLERARQMGLEAYLDEQLNPEGIEDTAAELLIRNLNAYHQDVGHLVTQEPVDVALELGAATLYRAVYSHRQLYEAMVEFWSDHFNIYLRKAPFMVFLKVLDDREAIRPHALGKFRDLLNASAHSPAMLVYLDNVRNVKGEPNENYARELMELHTLGVQGGYTQQDVQEVARALTGWGVGRRGRDEGQFRFDPDHHDTGAKQVLGHNLAAGRGEEDVLDVLEILVTHPGTARFIATKLVRRFVADEPPAALVERVAQVYTETDGDVKAMLRVIFLSEEFASAPPKLKRPYSYVVSALRALNAEVGQLRPFVHWLEALGQLPFHWPPPNGYPDVSAAWANNLLPRWNFALALLTGELRGAAVPFDELLAAGRVNTPADALDLLAGLTLGRSLDEEAQALFSGYVGDGRLADPRTQRRLREAAALLLASPAFQWT
ncbi:MAG: DUF1800 domain-containing protein [Chloroflexota bacterium]